MNDLTEIQNYLRKLPRRVGVIAVDFYQQSFRRQGYIDNSYTKWAARKKNTRAGRAILVRSGALRRSIRVVSVSTNRVVVGSDSPYAQIHNEGGRIAVPARQVINNFKRNKGGKTRFSKAKSAQFSQKNQVPAHEINMPQRQFMGASVFLEKRIVAQIENDVYKILTRR